MNPGHKISLALIVSLHLPIVAWAEETQQTQLAQQTPPTVEINGTALAATGATSMTGGCSLNVEQKASPSLVAMILLSTLALLRIRKKTKVKGI